MEKPRDELWAASWETFYDTSYYELLSSDISSKLQVFDFIVKLIVALTASGSAIAGWAFWGYEEYKNIWLFCAGIASVLSIFHSVLNTQNKIKEYNKFSDAISKFKIEYETFRHELKINSDFDVNKYLRKHKKLREQYQKVIAIIPSCFLVTEKFRVKIQDKLNLNLGVN